MIVSSFNEKKNNSVVICLGGFDSMHLGHQLLISKAVHIKKELNIDSAILTYDNDFGIISGKNKGLVFTLPERLKVLEKYAIDEVCVAHFDERFAVLSPLEFLHELCDNRHIEAFICGKDFKSRLTELSVLLDFNDLLRRPVGKLSGGQRRRIDIARALLHKPEILILDEPTTGLDPQTRSLLWKVIDDLRKKDGLTVFLTTHYMEEAADADYVVILDHGQTVAEGTPHSLKNTYTGDFITLYDVDENMVKNLGLPYEKIRNAYKILVKNTAEATDLIIKNPDLFTDYEIAKGKMDDVFLSVTGKTLIGGDNNE